MSVDTVELKRWISSRGYTRGQVTRLYNDRANFSLLTCTEKAVKRTMLNDFCQTLRNMDFDIQSAQFSITENGPELHKDIETCSTCRLIVLFIINTILLQISR